MAMQHAIRFLHDLDRLRDLRNILFECVGIEDVYQSLREAGYAFTRGEFEEAAKHILEAGPTEEIQRLRERIRMMRMVFTYV